MRLSRNMASMRIFNSYVKNLEAQSVAYKTVSSGYKIKTYKDDPNKKAQSDKLSIEIRSLQMANRNVQDSTSLLQTADGGMENISNSLQRMRELLVQGGGANSEDDKAAIQDEIDALLEHVSYVADNTEMNGVKLLSRDNIEGEELELLTGSTSEDKVKIVTHNLTSEGMGLINADGTSKISVDNVADGLLRVDSAIDKVNSSRSKYGAICNRMESTYKSMDEIISKVEGAEATISSADIALEMMEYTKNSILVESGLAMMAQTNKFPQEILQVLGNIQSR